MTANGHERSFRDISLNVLSLDCGDGLYDSVNLLKTTEL